MSGKPAVANDLDDAAFRARLAPLASEVLPRPVVLDPRSGPLLKDRVRSESSELEMVEAPVDPRPSARGRIVALSVTVALVALSVGWIYLGKPGSGVPGATLTKTGPKPVPAPDPAVEIVGLLLQRGNAALSVGDIMAARLLFERAAGMGSAAAAMALGKTYDITFLLEAGARGMPADQALAASWYRKAADLGDGEAQERLAKMAGGKKR